MPHIYHIATKKDWLFAIEVGGYTCDSLEKDGFIHCCFESQIDFVLSEFFNDRDELVLLKMDPEKIAAKIIEENSEGGEELFPHVYEVINFEAILDAQMLRRKDRKNDR